MTQNFPFRKVLIAVGLLLTIGLTNRANAQWAQKSNLFVFYEGCALGHAFALDGKVYTGGGWLAQKVNENQFYSYDPSNDQWQIIGNLPSNVTSRSGGIAFVVNNKAYIGLGAENFNQIGSVFLNDLWEYDASNNTWAQKASLPGNGRASATCFVANNKVYVAGGRWFNSSLQNIKTDELWEYDPATDKWTAKAAFPEGELSAAAATSVNNKGYVLGGVAANMNMTAAYEYDPAANKWTKKADFPEADGSSAGVAFEIGGIAYYGLGFTNVNQTQTSTKFYSYDAGADKWTAIQDFPGVGRGYPMVATVGNKAYIGGGRGSGKFLKDWYELTTTTGVGNVAKFTSEVSCYPNPSTGVINIKGLNSSNADYTLYNTLGVVIVRGALSGDKVDISAAPAGQYVIELSTDEGVVRKQISLIR